MKLIRYGENGNEKPGLYFQGKRLDCSAYFTDWNNDFFIHSGINELDSLIQKSVSSLSEVDENVRWGSPIARPGMILCVGLNYSDHARESGMPIPDEPVIFMKATNTMVGPYDDVLIPPKSNKTDWEVELGIVLGTNVNFLDNEQTAWDSIAGFTIVHDVSERSFQLEMGGQWVKGKSCPTFSPVGPYLVTKDEISDILNLDMQLEVNGKTMQQGSTRWMIFDPAYIIKYLSQFMQLEAGDLISTGTPPGVGLGMKPPVYLTHGDEVEMSISGLGKQRQVFKNTVL